ncbi:hypothetical protein NQ318_022666 [Aromia moschata]|uniref:Uncharacterized protein n=1 Tax=Aromia moschata TaxID=1265417 RepID=A0AAV8YNZ2_9CUCU|nr:hypothetical protein NQ318_022666 [Aromia moschata]
MFKPLICFFLFWIGSNAEQYTNPIAYNAPDPWLQYYKGYYYLVATTWTNQVGIRKASKLNQLVNAENTIVYTFDGHTLWAPEIHIIDGRWYLFYSACAPNTEDVACHRNHVAQSASDDPMGPYTFMADLDDPNDQNFELDPSYIFINGNQYLLGSYIPDVQNLYIRPMANPYTPTGAKRFWQVRPTTGKNRERTSTKVRNPYGRDGKIFVVYSASYCNTADYKLGILEFTGTDPLDSTHWYKHPDPIFQRSDANKVYGPGHNGFFRSPDDNEDWIVYHANSDESTGCTMERSSRAQKYTWDSNGLPIFGEPEALGVTYDGPAGE